MRRHCDDTAADSALGLDCAPGPAARDGDQAGAGDHAGAVHQAGAAHNHLGAAHGHPGAAHSHLGAAHGHPGAAHSHPRRGHKHPGSGHDHLPSTGADQRYLAVALGLIAAFMLVEVVVAVTSGSLALLADAGHMLTDAGALAGAMWAARLALRPAQGAWTFGLKRAEIISAAVNGVTLLAVALLVGKEAIDRLLHPIPVEGAAMLAVAGLGIVVNVAATLVLARANRSSLNVEGAFQHILTDAFAFAATLVAGLVIVVTGFERADPIASLIVVVLMLRAAWKLLRASGRVLLEGAPDHVDLAEVRAHVLAVPRVLDIHDLHAWVVTSDLPALSAHVVVEDDAFRDGQAPVILDRLQRCLAEHFDVEHSSFQLELARHEEHELAVH